MAAKKRMGGNHLLEDIMKNYLGILGAMALGAVIMFGFTHSEVQADGRPEPFVCSTTGSFVISGKERPLMIFNCRAKKLTCALNLEGNGGISCVHTGGLFK